MMAGIKNSYLPTITVRHGQDTSGITFLSM